VIKSHGDMDEMKTNTQAPMPLGRGNIRLHFSCETIVYVRELQGGLWQRVNITCGSALMHLLICILKI